MLWYGFLESTGHTISRGSGYVSAGYMGADFLAQIGSNLQNSVRPFVVHGTCGLTEDLMVGIGSGITRFRGNNARFEYIPFATVKYRVLSTDRSSAAIGGYAGYSTWANNTIWYGLSGSYSRSLDYGVALNAGLGMYGWYVPSVGHYYQSEVALAIGAEVRIYPQLRLVGELRSLGGWPVRDDENAEQFVEIVSSGLRYLGSRGSVEAGVARWMWEGGGGQTRPILSVAYVF